MKHPTYQRTSSIHGDGSRPKIRIADVAGRFSRLKPKVYTLLIGLFFVLPWIKVQGERLLLIYIEKRHFTIFGFGFNAQDIYLLFFLITGLGFSLFFITAMFGRIWCGWSCPQTVFLEGVFRKLERWIEGSRAQQILLDKAPWNAPKLSKFVIKHSLFVLMSIVIAFTFFLYFVPYQYFAEMKSEGLSSHPTLTFLLCLFSAIMYLDFSWFREQVCLILCPYGRFQSALTDDDTLVIGYDAIRGEPRGKLKSGSSGDCIDCGRCVAVCPTGIDIRAGLQMECIGCANCIDACDAIMASVHKPKGLIRYDSLNGLEQKPKKFFRPRFYLYCVLLAVGFVVASINFRSRTSFEANVLRLPGAPFVVDQETIRNQFELHLVNKSDKKITLHISAAGDAGMMFVLPVSEITLGSQEDRRLTWFASLPLSQNRGASTITLNIQQSDKTEHLTKSVPFLVPNKQ